MQVLINKDGGFGVPLSNHFVAIEMMTMPKTCLIIIIFLIHRNEYFEILSGYTFFS